MGVRSTQGGFEEVSLLFLIVVELKCLRSKFEPLHLFILEENKMFFSAVIELNTNRASLCIQYFR